MLVGTSPLVGIIGIGVVGSAMESSFREHGIDVVVYDKYREIGYISTLLDCTIIFVALPTNSSVSGEYDISALEENCKYLEENKYRGVVVVKSTVLPGTCDNLAEKYGLQLIHNPEFLSQKTACEDFHNQKRILFGRTIKCEEDNAIIVSSFYNKYYTGAKIILGTAKETESAKIYTNSFYAVKVQLFNEFYGASIASGIDYNNVVELMTDGNNWIEPSHTRVPGPDGQYSYGGMCLPKDIMALSTYMESLGVSGDIISATISERGKTRNNYI